MDANQTADIAHNIARVRERIAAACLRCGRDPAEVTLVAVTKTVPAERVRLACGFGLTDVGENRVQEAREKMPALHDLALRWHMIGHVQSNKAGQVADNFQFVQSVDSLELAVHLSRRMQGRGGATLPVLLEINIGAELTKSGFVVGNAGRAAFVASVEQIVRLPGLAVQGLMTVAPIASDAAQARPYFQQMRLLRDHLRTVLPQHTWNHLSMGMSDDFEVAIEEGATMVRVGRAIFGPRHV
jgi:PLP dependent protein